MNITTFNWISKCKKKTCVYTLSAQHGRLDGRQNLQLRADCRNSFANLQKVLKENSKLQLVNVLFAINAAIAHRSDALIRAFPSQLLSQSRHIFRRLRNQFGRRNQFALTALRVGSYQLRETSHKHCHSLGSRNDFVVLGRPLSHFLVQTMGGDKNGLVGQWNATEQFVFVVRFWWRRSTGRGIFSWQWWSHWCTIGV